MPIWTAVSRHHGAGRAALAALTITLAVLMVAAPPYSAAAASGDSGPQTSIDQQLAQPIVIVNTSYLNIRSGPGPIYSSIGVLPGGTELPVLARNADTSWWQVQSSYGRGWVFAEYVIPRGDFRAVPVGRVSEPATFQQSLAVIQTAPVTVYVQPNISSQVLGIALTASALRVTGQTVDGGWWQVETNVGLGWVRQEEVALQGSGGAVPIFDMTTATVPVTTTLDVQPQYARTYIIVNTSHLNIRSGPGGQFTVVQTVNGGTELDITGSTPDTAWFRVSGAFGTGWVDAEFVIFRGVFDAVPIIRYQEAVAPTTVPVAIVSAPINVYLGWGVETGLLGTAPAGLNLEVVGRTLDGAWYQVQTSLGPGWVLASTVTFRGNINQVPVVG